MRLSMHITAAVAAASLFCASPGLIAPANAQTIGSLYASTAPKDCGEALAANGVHDSTMRACPGKASLRGLVSADLSPRRPAGSQFEHGVQQGFGVGALGQPAKNVGKPVIEQQHRNTVDQRPGAGDGGGLFERQRLFATFFVASSPAPPAPTFR